jgi:hypothetical protein
MNKNELLDVIEQELAYCESDEILVSLKRALVPPYTMTRKFEYGPQGKMECWVVAEAPAESEVLVYCSTGFGPSFPWGIQDRHEPSMGRDDAWFAYLCEAFIESRLWKGPMPEGFESKGPGERRKCSR